MSEHAKLLMEIENERLKLREEKARLEIAKTLQSKNSDDSGLSRAEIDASVKYAEVNNFHYKPKNKSFVLEAPADSTKSIHNQVLIKKHFFFILFSLLSTCFKHQECCKRS